MPDATPAAHGRPWHTLSASEAASAMRADPVRGLSPAEARDRLATQGPNRLREKEREGFWEEYAEELREPMILLLLVTGVLYSVLGTLEDAITIFAIIFTLVAVEVINEQRAHRAIEALRDLAEPTGAVIRGGRREEIPVEALVPGDLLVLEAGRRVPADARLIGAAGLSVTEASLTGESVPVEKDPNAVLPEATPLAERRNLVFAGTTVVRGRGTAVVVGTGMGTELGKIAALAEEIEEPKTPLQVAMADLTKYLVFVAVGFSILVPLLGWLLANQDPRTMVLTGLSMAFVTIPEELPILITMVLALGAFRLSRQHAIAKRLRAVETLGGVTVIVTDKTGTLTENRMQVTRFFPEGAKAALLEAGVLCNDASLDGGSGHGDPLEVALLRAAEDAGIAAGPLRNAHPLRDEYSFDNERKRMSVVCSEDGGLRVVAKGAPESLLAACSQRWTADGVVPLTDANRLLILSSASGLAGSGQRVLGLGEKRVPGTVLPASQVESDLVFLGLLGLSDPPRPEAKPSIDACRAAGVRPVMVTGDHPLTAQAIAAQIGLDGGRVITGPELDALPDAKLQEVIRDVSVYARTTPEHKLRIVKAFRSSGQRVAVTGDGINDAPALAAADIGVAMGETGTDVAREAADLVLADDNFATIVRAVSEGRILFANLRKAVRYYLACKVAVVGITLLPVLLRVPIPFAPIQLIVLELFMDLAASATFVAEPPESDLMRQPPRDPQERFMSRPMVASIFTSAAGLFLAVSGAYLFTYYSGATLAVAQTTAFVTWLLGHVFLALNLRSEREPLVRLGLLSNRLMIIWGGAAILFALFASFTPGVQSVLRTASLGAPQWALALALALLGTFWIELRKWLVPVRPPEPAGLRSS
ncbi:MAG TPA: cation-translocating P-type ATPase [Thermoplasmata archaeon]|nr:cation-translocating P-type ATPase [Thermoplasmata archaeon]